MENMNPIGVDGDGYLQPLNFAPLGTDNQDEDPTSSRAMLEPVVCDAVTRTLRVERNAVARRVKKHLERDNAEGEPFLRWVAEHYDGLHERMAGALAPAIESSVAAGADRLHVEDGVRRIASDYAEQSRESLGEIVRFSDSATEAATELRSMTNDEEATDEQIVILSEEILGVLIDG